MRSCLATGVLLSIFAIVGVARCAEPADKPASRTKPESLLLFAAASTKEAVDEVAANFERSHASVSVKTSYGASSTLAQQLIAGAEADLFLSANESWTAKLDEEGLVAKQHELLGNELVLVVATGSKIKPAEPADLLSDGVERLALAEPESVPAGIYAKQALEKLKLWDRLKPKVVGAADVRQALAYVETGAAEAGIVYATDAAVTNKVKIAFRFDAGLTEPIVYPLVLLKRGASKSSAQALYETFRSDAAAKIYRRRGFTLRSPVPISKP
ncbi:MAG TPA: molybdate ABC transporter substrate-binding protein [Pirellulales bacterium]|nr:molybdate ABC transporter substrate-binding protein [Pirellulales bacterium]